MKSPLLHPFTLALLVLAVVTLITLSQFWIGSHEDLLRMRQENFCGLFFQRWLAALVVAGVFLLMHAIHLFKFMGRPIDTMKMARWQVLALLATTYAVVSAIVTIWFVTG